MYPRIIATAFVLISSLGYGFKAIILNNINNSSSDSFDPFEYLRTHTSTVNNYGNLPLLIPFIIILLVFIIAWMISKRRRKEN